MIVRRAKREDIPEVDAFLRSQASLCAGWDHKGMTEWLHWFNDAVLVGGVWKDDKLQTLCMGRPTNDPFSTAQDHYYLKRDGHIIWVDFFGGKMKEHGVALLELTFKHWGWRWPDDGRSMAFNRNLLGRKEVKIHRIKDICRFFQNT